MQLFLQVFLQLLTWDVPHCAWRVFAARAELSNCARMLFGVPGVYSRRILTWDISHCAWRIFAARAELSNGARTLSGVPGVYSRCAWRVFAERRSEPSGGSIPVVESESQRLVSNPLCGRRDDEAL